MDTTPVIDDALKLLGRTDPNARENLTTALTAQGLIKTHRALSPQPLVCVDGAVASTQTDVLLWTAATAANSDNDHSIIHQGVAPIGPSTDRLRSAMMALCEMEMALYASKSAETVWMDGGLSTPLISVSTALSGTDLSAFPALDALLERTNAPKIIHHYTELAQSGRLRALPKQDTATGYAEKWKQLPGLDDSTQLWVGDRADRALAYSVLTPGQFLAPRRAVEAQRVKIRTNDQAGDAVRQWVEKLNPQFEKWRNHVHAYVTYGMPESGPGRPVKVEFTIRQDEDANDAAQASVEVAASHISGAQIVEPLPQFLVDSTAKRQVTAEMLNLMTIAEQHLGGHHPEAVNAYRS